VLSAASEAAAEKINWLQVDLDYEVAVQSSQKKELELLKGEGCPTGSAVGRSRRVGGEELGIAEEGLRAATEGDIIPVGSAGTGGDASAG